MHADLLHPSRFLKSAEFNGRDVTYTIAEVALEELERDDNSKETKGIVAFRETSKLLLLNRTNSTCLKEMFGVETDAWKGKRVTFFPFPMVDPFTKKPITAIRLRGSPDLKAPVGVSIKLRKRKAQTMTMQITGAASAAPLASGDQYDMELTALRAQIVALTTPEAMDAAWRGGMSGRIARLQPPDQVEIKRVFSAHKSALLKGPPTDPPPPTEPTEPTEPPAAEPV